MSIRWALLIINVLLFVAISVAAQEPTPPARPGLKKAVEAGKLTVQVIGAYFDQADLIDGKDVKLSANKLLVVEVLVKNGSADAKEVAPKNELTPRDDQGRVVKPADLPPGWRVPGTPKPTDRVRAGQAHMFVLPFAPPATDAKSLDLDLEWAWGKAGFRIPTAEVRGWPKK